MALICLVIGFIAHIVKSVLIGVITSVSLFVIGVSVVTQKFPPDLSVYQDHIAEVRAQLKTLTVQSTNINNLNKQTVVMQPPQGPEAHIDAEEMIRIHENKIKLGREIAGAVAPIANRASQFESKAENEKLRREIEYLKSRVIRLENHIISNGKNHSN